MNVDEAMARAADYLAYKKDGWTLLIAKEVAITLAAEVERLRAELAAAKAASVVTDEEVQAAFDNWYDSDDEGEPFNDIGKFFMGDGWKAGVDWLRQKIGNGITGENKNG